MKAENTVNQYVSGGTGYFNFQWNFATVKTKCIKETFACSYQPASLLVQVSNSGMQHESRKHSKPISKWRYGLFQFSIQICNRKGKVNQEDFGLHISISVFTSSNSKLQTAAGKPKTLKPNM
jgi:hypothetical protein